MYEITFFVTGKLHADDYSMISHLLALAEHFESFFEFWKETLDLLWPGRAITTHTALTSMAQGKRSVHIYCAKVRQVAKQTPNLGSQYIQFFITGLNNEKLRAKLFDLFDPTETLDEVIEKAKEEDAKLRHATVSTDATSIQRNKNRYIAEGAGVVAKTTNNNWRGRSRSSARAQSTRRNVTIAPMRANTPARTQSRPRGRSISAIRTEPAASTSGSGNGPKCARCLGSHRFAGNRDRCRKACPVCGIPFARAEHNAVNCNRLPKNKEAAQKKLRQLRNK